MKKNLKSVSFWMVVFSSVLSVIFLGIYTWAGNCFRADPFFSQTTVYVAYYLEVFFSSLSLFICYGVIIYSFARYTPDKAKFSFVYLGLNLAIYLVFEVVNICVQTTAFDASIIYNTICAISGRVIIEQVLPAILVAFIAHKITKNGIQRVTSFISWKNSLQRAMIISTLVIFGINMLLLLSLNMFPYLIENNFYITLNNFIDMVILPICEKLIFSIALQYSTYMLMYVICNKYGETNGLTQKNNK